MDSKSLQSRDDLESQIQDEKEILDSIGKRISHALYIRDHRTADQLIAEEYAREQNLGVLRNRLRAALGLEQKEFAVPVLGAKLSDFSSK